MQIPPKTCDGCSMIKAGLECKILEVYRAKDCPCIDCIIKMMCDTACEKYLVVVETAITRWRERHKNRNQSTKSIRPLY